MSAIVVTSKIAYTTVAFNKAFDHAKKIEYKSEWANGTGYYNGAVLGDDAPKLAIGEIVCAHSPMPNDRKLVIVGTPLGNVVVFQRYSGGEHGTYVSNATMTFNRHIGNRLNRPLSENDITYLLGDGEFPTLYKNVGVSLTALLKAVEKFDGACGVS